MRNEEWRSKSIFLDSNERIISVAKDENRYNYETQQIEDVFMRRDFEAKEKAIKALEQRWIPVSERMPEEFICDDGYVEPSDYVLVWGDHGNYGVSRYWGNRRSKIENPNSYKDWMDLDWVVQKPIAWMPLPEPYKSESEDAE